MADLRKVIQELPVDKRAAIAERIDCSPVYLRQIAYGYRNASIDLAFELEEELGQRGAESLVNEANAKTIKRLRGMKR